MQRNRLRLHTFFDAVMADLSSQAFEDWYCDLWGGLGDPGKRGTWQIQLHNDWGRGEGESTCCEKCSDEDAGLRPRYNPYACEDGMPVDDGMYPDKALQCLLC